MGRDRKLCKTYRQMRGEKQIKETHTLHEPIYDVVGFFLTKILHVYLSIYRHVYKGRADARQVPMKQ